ncbi:MAG: hypothetical protein CVT85_09855 [Alphaproteobacteria bacterium HGW-Alphaproteobacteria-7]|jgi:hypothetical protein|nr:MAG: hypothetical protein CVT85_09855 [Alphaproteobacteria bacterium HGW-Alphaproteobacteria-7]
MRLATLMATFLLAATPANAQSVPYKLILIHGENGITVIDYPSAARCEAARSAIQRIVDQENKGKEPQILPGGGVIFPTLLIMKAYCIPG